MEHAKLTKRNASELPLERAHAAQMNKTGSAVKKAVRKKAVATRAKPVRLLQNRLGSESKSDELVCRYCGSDDLAPSFIKRRDRRCRKCFGERYGSAARAKDAKVKK
jgi:hypothetical protein